MAEKPSSTHIVVKLLTDADAADADGQRTDGRFGIAIAHMFAKIVSNP